MSEQWTAQEIKQFYADAKARNLVPTKFQEAIEWWNEQISDWSDGSDL